MTDAAAPPPDIRILGGSPDDEELAALTAVLSSALAQLAAEDRPSRALRADGWSAARRSLRSPLTRNAWRSYGA